MFEYLIHFIVSKQLISINKLFLLRRLSKFWKLRIECESLEVNKIIKFIKDIDNRLYYDKSVYDQYFYKRLIIKNILN